MTATVYVDNAATTAVDPRVAAEMLECLGADGDFANPSAINHAPGRRARERVERARVEVAALVAADPAGVVWTSGATESDNLAILGAARFNRSRGRHIVTARTEHAAVLDPCRQLEREGFAVTYLRPDHHGIVSTDQLEAALRNDTLLVSLMHVNNETGVVQDVAAYGRICRERNILLHVDAAQSAGKLPVNARDCQIDLLSVTAHKVHGPKGVGALCVRTEPRVGLMPLQFGGGHERGVRSGTLPTHQIVGMGAAFRVASSEMAAEAVRLAGLRDRLWQQLAPLRDVSLNGHPSFRAPGILNITIAGVEGESLLFRLHDVALSSGSACATTSGEPSYVLRALGRSDPQAQSSLRISLGRFNTVADVDFVARRVREEVERLRSIAPARPGSAA